MVPHIEKPVPDREPQPDAAGRMTVDAGLDLDAEHLRAPADRNPLRRDAARQPRRDRLGGEHRRHPDPLAQPQRAGMVVVAVAQDDGIDPPDLGDVGQPAGLGSGAAIEQETPRIGLDHERGRLLGAETRYRVQLRPHR